MAQVATARNDPVLALILRPLNLEATPRSLTHKSKFTICAADST